MSNFRQQFQKFKESTPRHVLWLLMAAAFIVVLILLTLLLTRNTNKNTHATIPSGKPVELVISTQTIDWTNTPVGEQRDEKVKINANEPTIVGGLRRTRDIPGLKVNTTCTTDIGKIDTVVPCYITLTYKPTTALENTGLPIYIDYYGATESKEMKQTTQVMLTIGAIASETPEPVVKPEPEPEPVSEPEPEPVPEPKDTIQQEIEAIAPQIVLPEPESAPLPTPAPARKNVSNGCSEFAFPGFNATGNQIGWIKPLHGAYYFYPLSDRECTTPTGVYNPDNGIITDIDNPGRKIGTDAEHIGYTIITDGTLPNLSNPKDITRGGRARQYSKEELEAFTAPDNNQTTKWTDNSFSIVKKRAAPDVIIGTSGNATLSTEPYDRTFVLRQYKPIPATIVSEVRSDPSIYEKQGHKLPVRATVDRNVYSDNGRTVVIPAGTLLLGYLTGDLPGPYKSIGRMQINWYQFILPNGSEFNFTGKSGEDPFSADAQGRVGVPGHGSTDYVEQFVMPLLTAIVPAAVNMIAPISDTFVNKINLDSNTVTQSGTLRSSELAKNEIITAWNQVAQKLLVDMIDNTVPPLSIAAGTRITVFSPTDLIITCGSGNDKKCSVEKFGQDVQPKRQRATPTWDAKPNYDDGTWVGQVRSFNIAQYCDPTTGKVTANAQTIIEAGFDYRTVAFFCQSAQYQAINNAKQTALYQNQQSTTNTNSIAALGKGGTPTNPTKEYNENVLGLKYNDETGAIENPFQKPATSSTTNQEPAITCLDGSTPDANGCCPGETFTDMGAAYDETGLTFACCPDTGGDCYPPIQ